MDSELLRVLLIEDNPIDARVIHDYLVGRKGVRINLEHAERLSSGLDRLTDGRFDAVLLDLNLPDSTGLETVVQARERNPHVPIVVLTGDDADELALDAMKAGAEDYLCKSELEPKLLARTIRYAIERAGRRKVDERLTQSLHDSDAKLRGLFENLPDLVLLLDRSGKIEFVNRAVPGANGDGLLGWEGFGYIVPEHRAGCYEAHQQAILTGQVQTLESLDIHGNWWACRFTHIKGIGETDHVMAICTDITQQKRVDSVLGEKEQRYRQLLAAVNSYTYSVKLKDGEPVSTDHSWGCLSVTGYTPDDYRSDPYLWITMVHHADQEMVRRYVAAILSGEEVPPIEHRIVRRDGEIRWLRATIVPHHDGEKLVRYDGLVEDITDRWLAEQALRERNVQLVAAQKIQKHLLPSQAPTLEGFDIGGASYPAEFTAGDFFDYLTMPNGTMGFVIGDVLGHGFSSALLMASTSTLVRLLAETHREVDEILEKVNRFLMKETENSFVTLLLARLDPQTRSFVYASGGHPAGYILDSSGAMKACLESTSLPLAIFADTEFPAAQPIILEPGDLVVLLTDGIQEAISPDERMLGIPRVLDVVRANQTKAAADIVKALRQLVYEFSQSEKLVDDLTAIVIKVC